MLARLALLAVLSTVPARAGDDPITGVWQGTGKGKSELVPPEGVPFTVVLERKGEDAARVTLTIEGMNACPPVEAEYDADGGAIECRCDLMGILVDLELALVGEELTGKASGLGVAIDLTGKRTSKTLPAPAAPAAGDAPVDLSALTSADWRADLAFLAEELPKKHKNAYHALSAEEWQRAVRELDGKLATLSSATAAVELARLVARIGDAHTELALVGKPFDRWFPVGFVWFADGVWVTIADERFEDLVGLRVLAIGAKSAEEALAAVDSTFASENDSWPHAKGPPKLANPALLAALGVTADDRTIPVTVAGADGERVTVAVDGVAKGTWKMAPDRALVPTPTSLLRTREAYWFQPLEAEHAVYFAFNRCAEDPARPMAGFLEQVFAALARPGMERLVIDLRRNSGGNSLVLGNFVPELARRVPSGGLRVLIGPTTFSSGVHNAVALRGVGAKLYGEPSGGKPNSYGEVRSFVLPRSRLAVYHSTNLFRLVEDGDPPALAPDVVVPTAAADYFAGADPVLERALRAD